MAAIPRTQDAQERLQPAAAGRSAASEPAAPPRNGRFVRPAASGPRRRYSARSSRVARVRKRQRASRRSIEADERHSRGARPPSRFTRHRSPAACTTLEAQARGETHAEARKHGSRRSREPRRAARGVGRQRMLHARTCLDPRRAARPARQLPPLAQESRFQSDLRREGEDLKEAAAVDSIPGARRVRRHRRDGQTRSMWPPAAWRL